MAGDRASRITERLFGAENESSFAAKARRARWAQLLDRFRDLAEMRVLDLGGTPWAWHAAPARPTRIVTLNLEPLPGPDWVEARVGDACDPPADLLSEQFDFVYSNSVIEHVGGHWRRKAFAEAVHRLAPHHWVQTPARSFPLEPHWLFPGFQFLPVAARVSISRRWSLGHMPRHEESTARATEEVLSVELITPSEMRILFPSSDLLRERALGMTKSLIATC